MKKSLSILSILALCLLCFFGGRVSKRCGCIAPTNDTIYIERTDALRISDFGTIVENVVRYKQIA